MTEDDHQHRGNPQELKSAVPMLKLWHLLHLLSDSFPLISSHSTSGRHLLQGEKLLRDPPRIPLPGVLPERLLPKLRGLFLLQKLR